MPSTHRRGACRSPRASTSRKKEPALRHRRPGVPPFFGTEKWGFHIVGFCHWYREESFWRPDAQNGCDSWIAALTRRTRGSSAGGGCSASVHAFSVPPPCRAVTVLWGCSPSHRSSPHGWAGGGGGGRGSAPCGLDHCTHSIHVREAGQPAFTPWGLSPRMTSLEHHLHHLISFHIPQRISRRSFSCDPARSKQSQIPCRVASRNKVVYRETDHGKSASLPPCTCTSPAPALPCRNSSKKIGTRHLTPFEQHPFPWTTSHMAHCAVERAFGGCLLLSGYIGFAGGSILDKRLL